MDAGIYCACRAIHPEWEWGSKIFEVYAYRWLKYSVYYIFHLLGRYICYQNIILLPWFNWLARCSMYEVANRSVSILLSFLSTGSVGMSSLLQISKKN